jgi:ribosomal protein L11 methyltransferase
MSFLSITLALNRDSADAFGDALMELGALSVSVEDADEGTIAERAIFGEPGATGGLWDRCELTALFAENVDGVEILWQVAALFDTELHQNNH